ncbi:hypothetical protein EZJ19_01465 [Parasulfuritortus cantonensis]|uniref:Uncharacterized protein n=1 Tax=Parasulfuritortus cantonensis TaxID=2528202 RepID=A0A4R1BPJ7_9PROT|nr:hypothetical protein [Parasulfuritortus cantonensis]TCJ19534.1 hypothetical protein EZJ19_01465 [Parasulfuritortus cantonensis]
MLSAPVHAWRAALGLLRTPAFWLLLVAFLGIALALAALIVFAVERHDTFLRLRPMLCEQGAADRKVFLVAVAAPPWLVFVLISVAELWQQAGNWWAGRAARWRHFWLFLGLASGLGAALLFGLSC